MNRHVASAFAYVSTVAAATVAAALMATSAYAEGPILQDTPFVSTRTRADVRAELMSQAEQVRTGSTEWAMQFNQPVQLAQRLHDRAGQVRVQGGPRRGARDDLGRQRLQLSRQHAGPHEKHRRHGRNGALNPGRGSSARLPRQLTPRPA